MKYLNSVAMFLASSIFFVLSGCSQGTSVTAQLEKEFQQAISNASSAVVTIEITTSDSSHSPDDVVFRNAGVIIDKDGTIATTCDHITGESGFNVLFQDGCSAEAEIIGSDRETNIAIFKTPVHVCGCFPIEINVETEVKSGSFGLIINNSTVSKGVTAGLGIMAESWLGGDDNWSKPMMLIQTGDILTMAGAPVIGITSRLIGICDAKIESHNGAWTVISAETVLKSARALKETGTVERGWIGIRCSVEEEELFGKTGVKPYIRINQVIENSPAEKAGLKEGDFITRSNSVPISDINRLRTTVTSLNSGEKLILEIVRSDSIVQVVELSTKQLPKDTKRNRLCSTRSL